MTHRQSAYALLLLGLCWIPFHAFADSYSSGLGAARAGAWEEALEHFSAARRAGVEEPALTYNLGVANLQLGRFDAAAAAFRRLAEDTEWRALAYYNLGITEEKRGRDAVARGYFERARDAAQIEKLRLLAENRLGAQPEPAAPRRLRWIGIASLAAGYDDNVILADDQLIDAVSDEGDAFGEFLGAMRRPLTLSGSLTLDLAGYYRRHADLSDFDFGSASTALLWHHPLGDWQLSTGFTGAAQFVGGESYANVVGYRLQLERQRASWSWLARNVSRYYFAAEDFDYVEGWSNATRLQVGRRVRAVGVKAGYEFELNDREDLISGDEFASYSPQRHRLYAAGSVSIGHLDIEVLGGMKMSDYTDANRFLDDSGTLIEEARDQDILYGSLRLTYQLSPHWQIWSQYRHNDSDSEIVRYDYAASAYMLGLESRF